MNLAELQRKLLAAARAHPPGDAVPYAFEKRIMARLTGSAPADAWTLWSRALWRAAATCALLALLSGAWSWWSGTERRASEFSQEFESAVFVMNDAADEAW